MSVWSKRELLSYMERVEPALDRLSHYEILDIDADADWHQIQGAFHRLAGRLHPDRYRLALSAADHERLTIIYGRLAEAYQILRDPGRREQYLKEVARDRPEAAEGDMDVDSALALLSPKAQRLYRRAQAALRDVLGALPDPPSYSAVRAILNTLVEKGHLRRKKTGKKFNYLPTLPRKKELNIS